ncbi:MAG: hypothetical protein O2955_11675 [Planctomycetota bacterium]|nr:hypothetical protein [Planctomycetota bacterium]MDA1213170.1 hypothetical protein [Planctomycetota bacterium]
MHKAESQLKRVLRILGVIDLLALIAVFMSRAQMASLHDWSGLESFPEGTVVGYLARSASLMYALHGALILYLSTDVVRYAAVIRFLGFAALVHGAAVFAIDMIEAMPMWWRWVEGPCFATTGLIVLLMQRRLPREANPA